MRARAIGARRDRPPAGLRNMPERAGTAIIVGAGPGGLTAAIALRRAGYRVTVCERTSSLQAAGSGLTLWPNATRALAELDLLPRLATAARPLTAIAMKNWRGRTLFEHALATLLDDPRFPSVGLLRTELIDLLAPPVQDRILLAARVVDFAQDKNRIVVQLADGRELAGDVLIGADGFHSVVRTHLVGRDPLSYAGYTVWRGIAAIDFAAAVGTTWMGPAKQFGLFPLSGERTYWFAASKAAEGEGGTECVRRELDSAFADAPAPIPDVIGRTEDAAILRTDIYYRAPLQRWSFGRAALLGDAAHPAAPTLGQGACQAIEDGVVLGACFAGGADVETALRRYEVRRIRRANAFVAEARRIGELGLWENALVCRLRDAMIGAMPLRLHRKQLARMFDFAL